MQVPSSTSSSSCVNIVFTQQPASWGEDEDAQEVSMFLESDEEILHSCGGKLLLNLFSGGSNFYRMNADAVARAVALGAIDDVVEACMNRDDVIAAVMMEEMMMNGGGEEEDEEVVEPQWLVGNHKGDEENSVMGIRRSTAIRTEEGGEFVIPVVQLHPAFSVENKRLVAACNESIFDSDDVEALWPFLERSSALAFRGWVEFVVRKLHGQYEDDDEEDDDEKFFLCIKLINDGRRRMMRK